MYGVCKHLMSAITYCFMENMFEINLHDIAMFLVDRVSNQFGNVPRSHKNELEVSYSFQTSMLLLLSSNRRSTSLGLFHLNVYRGPEEMQNWNRGVGWGKLRCLTKCWMSTKISWNRGSVGGFRKNFPAPMHLHCTWNIPKSVQEPDCHNIICNAGDVFNQACTTTLVSELTCN